MRRLVLAQLPVAWVFTCSLALGATATVTVDPLEATVGDALSVRVTVEGGAEDGPVIEKLGPNLGPFRVLEEHWSEEATVEGAMQWVWSGRVAAYKIGDLVFPGLSLAGAAPEGETWTTEPVGVRIVSVLERPPEGAEEAPVEIADLKAPARLNPNYGPLRLAGGLLLLLIAVAGLAWWLHRRYGDRFDAAEPVHDPFARIAPHEWAFEALRDLLEKNPSFATEDLFYAELAWILKRYLGGRYRVDLLERTTDELQPLLEQAGAPTTAATRAGAVLQRCDAVKFAKRAGTQSDRKEIVERVYGIVDQTKPSIPLKQVRSGAA